MFLFRAMGGYFDCSCTRAGVSECAVPSIPGPLCGHWCPWGALPQVCRWAFITQAACFTRPLRASTLTATPTTTTSAARTTTSVSPNWRGTCTCDEASPLACDSTSSQESCSVSCHLCTVHIASSKRQISRLSFLWCTCGLYSKWTVTHKP